MSEAVTPRDSRDFLESGREPGKVSLSNRRETSVLKKDSAIGIDRCSVSFRLQDFDAEPSKWASHQRGYSEGEPVSETFSAQVKIGPGVSAFVGVRRLDVTRGIGLGGVDVAPVFGKIEFNPSRFVDPDGSSLATVDQTFDSLQLAVDAAATLVTPFLHDGLSSFRLKRLDAAKDFRSPIPPAALIRGLAPIPRKWARKNLVHADPSRNGAQTLLVGSNAGAARLYDKFAEAGGNVEPGTVRCEIEARGDWLHKYGGLRTMDDLRKVGVGGLSRDRFEWSAMGVEVVSSMGVVDALSQTDLTPREQTMFLGWLVNQSSPYAYVPGSKALAKWRRIQRDLNIALGPDAVSSVGFSSRIDWDSGLVVTRVS
jgi:hypothetical protein